MKIFITDTTSSEVIQHQKMLRSERTTASANVESQAVRHQRAGHDDAALAFAQGGKPTLKLRQRIRSISGKRSFNS